MGLEKPSLHTLQHLGQREKQITEDGEMVLTRFANDHQESSAITGHQTILHEQLGVELAPPEKLLRRTAECISHFSGAPVRIGCCSLTN
jgi:hypothetical protein